MKSELSGGDVDDVGSFLYGFFAVVPVVGFTDASSCGAVEEDEGFSFHVRWMGEKYVIEFRSKLTIFL